MNIKYKNYKNENMKLGEQGLYVNRGGQIKNPHVPPKNLRGRDVACS